MSRACHRCLGTDTQRECEQGQCYAEHEDEQQRRHDAEMERRYQEDPPQ